MDSILQNIISFLGGGILGTLIKWARVSRSERTTRKHEFIKDQIAKVYGPLYFFVGLNESLFALNNKFHKAYEDHFINEKWSDDTCTIENLKKETTATVDLANHYIALVRDNNRKIMNILRDNYAYIDPEDTEVLQQFIIDHLRMEREFKADKPLEVPLEIYYKVGEISYCRKAFTELINKKFIEKNNILKSIQ